MPVLLPDDYIPDVNMRLSFYKRIASAQNDDELAELKVELIDRFGTLPAPGRQLLQSASIRLTAQKLGIRRIEAHEKGGFIEFSQNNKVDLNYLIKLLQTQPNIYRLDGSSRLKFMTDLTERTTRLSFVQILLEAFEQNQI